MAYEKDPNELGCLWLREGPRGPYMTGSIDGVEVICFPVTKRSERSPAWRVMKSKPRESQTMEDPAEFRREREQAQRPPSPQPKPEQAPSIAPSSDDMDW